MNKFLTFDAEYGDQEEYTTEEKAVKAAKRAIADGVTNGPISIYRKIGLVGEERPKVEKINYKKFD